MTNYIIARDTIRKRTWTIYLRDESVSAYCLRPWCIGFKTKRDATYVLEYLLG